jgi:GAF domain-containing protein
LRFEETVLGFLRIYSGEKRSYSDDEMDLLMKFADQAAQAVENAMAYERVRSDIEGMKKSIPRPVVRRMQEQS